MNSDRLSGLPDNIIDNILSRLLPKEAAKTSVLSMQWRYRSAMLKDLEFDSSSCRYEKPIFAKMVDHILLLHMGPIRKFKLDFTRHVSSFGSDIDRWITRVSSFGSDIDRWITRVSRYPLEEFIFSRMGKPYNIPFCVFSIQDLVLLDLTGCLIKLPSKFQGFRSLKTIKLSGVDIEQDVFETSIRLSPLLEELKLQLCHRVTNLKINEPNLKHMLVWGYFEAVDLESAISDTHAILYVIKQYNSAHPSCDLLKLINQLPRIQRLEISKDLMKSLSSGTVPEELPKSCLQFLKVLSVRTCFDDPDSILATLCILRSSSALQQLNISMGCDQREIGGPIVEEKIFSWLKVSYNFTLPQLRIVNISEITDGIQDFVRFILTSSPLLERMTIKPRACERINLDNISSMVRELLQFQSKSKHVEITFMDLPRWRM